MDSDDPKRQGRLNKTFQDIISGKTKLSAKGAKIFLEAISKHRKPEACFTAILTSPAGSPALQDALKFDLTPNFFNTFLSSLIPSLRDKDLAATNNGVLFQDVLKKLSGPEMVLFWMEFRKAFLGGNLDENGSRAFGWLYWKLLLTGVSQVDNDVSTIIHHLTSSPIHEIQKIGQEIQKVLLTSQSTNVVDTLTDSAPGRRHDNDHSDFRKISILPTQGEIVGKDTAFLRPASFLEDAAIEQNRVALHLDNQFRLLREDMLSEMKDEFQIATGAKKGHARGVKIKGLEMIALDCGPASKRDKWGLVCQCKEDLPQLAKFTDEEDRRAYLKDKRQFFKHQSLICLMVDSEIIGFASTNRVEELLIKKPPQVVLQLSDEESVKGVLHGLKLKNEVSLIQINTAVFAYEPVLKALQQAKTLSLSNELLLWKQDDILEEVDVQASTVLEAMLHKPGTNLKNVLDTPKDIILDSSQARSLISGLTQKVSLIQGPPGTGKSFIGALVAKAIHDFTERTILVVCYTNHALDDILEGLLDIGIPESSMLRMGGKSTTRTEPLLLNKQPRGANRSRDEWNYINELRAQLEILYQKFTTTFDQFITSTIRSKDVLEFLEFLDGDLDYFNAFQVPNSTDGFDIAGRDGKAIGPEYLFERWYKGEDAGRFKNHDVCNSEECKAVWSVLPATRMKLLNSWKDTLLRESIDEVCANAMAYNQCQQRLNQASRSDTTGILRSKRVVGCTTTAAAKYREEIQAFNPDVLLVEEAGEILESHVLMSLGPETSQMILIGDHKQLRPKVNNYALTVEKGNGYDLNRSLFERLILRGYPHETLSQQHRMRPEISALIRHLTYPELVDALKTQNRPDIRGVRDNIVFINHDHLEDEFKDISEIRDMGSTSSKQNSYEIKMVLKIVRYLGQQGYGTNDLVILTPYLGQLSKLRDVMKSENDPILNDLDSGELIRAGLLDPVMGKLKKKQIRLATIDNYQGEESDIVIVSLTRSNPRCDIGFMYSPERLNVLLSRARNGLIMLGNAKTFRNARKGKELWQDLLDMLQKDNHMYQGLPVKCEQHVDTTTLLCDPDAFDDHCPDGGCLIPCGLRLSCGLHVCPLKCHKQRDHSTTPCTQKMLYECSAKNHAIRYECRAGPPPICPECDREQRLATKKQMRDLAQQQKRDDEQRAHNEAMDKLNAQIEEERQRRQNEELQQQRENAIRQKKQDLENMKAQLQTSKPQVTSAPTSSSFPATTPTIPLQDGRATPPPATRTQDGRSNPPPTPTQNGGSRPAQAPPDPIPTASVKPSAENGRTKDSSILTKMWNAVSNLSVGQVSSQSSSSGKPFKKLATSQAKEDWEYQKMYSRARNDAIDEVMQMTGLEEVKKQIMKILAKIEVADRQNASLKRDRFNVSFLGNPGTGKTTVARHYAKFLASVGVIPGNKFEELTGASLANKGVDYAEQVLNAVTGAGGGVIFIDEAYQLTSGNNPGGAAVLDYLLAEMENRVGTLVFIFAGYDREMEKFFQHNPGLKSRVPYEFHFSDYEDEELMAMFDGMVRKLYGGKMKFEGGSIEGLYGRIVIRRLGRRRGRPGFGNARDLENILSKIRERQASRLKSERKNGIRPDDFLLTAEDMIGPDPSSAILKSKAYEKLQDMIGLKAVKDTVASLVSIMSENFHREVKEKEPLDISLNRVFLGSPGTGKTTVAKLYGQILADIGILSNGEVLLKNPSDFIGAVIGASEANTKAILANSAGKVLIIDEAYMLYGGGGDGESAGKQSNQFKTSVIDTLVAEVQSTPGEDRCVLLLGYREQMMEMFQNVNPGLSRRFKIEDAFNFEDFTDDELLRILDKKLKEQDLSATDPARKVAIELLSRMRNRPNFGNAGEVENLITQAKTRALARRKQMPASERADQIDIVFVPEDFDPDCNREANADKNLAKLFEDIVGHEAIIQLLRDYQEIAKSCKARNIDPRHQVPTNFIFTGPPGTGKTTIARKVGQVFYDMGLLSSAEVIECSASDLVGQYVGHTGPKTKKLFEKALGKVLFIDEAYRLSQGHFAQEAIDELVGLLTHPTFKSKLVVVLAGYEQDMNKLMSINTGLASRFPNQVTFPNMTAEECLKVIKKELEKKDVEVNGWADESESSDFVVQMKKLIQDLMNLPDWGNARDMVTLSNQMISAALLLNNTANTQGQTHLAISSGDALDVVKKMIHERQRRAMIPKKHRPVTQLPVQSNQDADSPPPLGTSTDTNSQPSTSATTPNSPANQQTENSASSHGRGGHRGRGRGNRGRQGGMRGHNQPTMATDEIAPVTPRSAQPQLPQNGRHRQAERDPGVSNAIWFELNRAKQAAEARERRARLEIKALQDKLAEQRKQEEEEEERLKELERQVANAEAARKAQIEREKEETRKRMRAAIEEKKKKDAELRTKQEAERRRKQMEERVQRRLQELGVCVMGFQWINMGNYYRCAGGSHTVSMSQIGNV